MNPMEELKTEHRAVRNALTILAEIGRRLEAGNDLKAVEDAADLLEFLKIFVDKCHHGKEERLLFPALEKIGISRQGGPIGVMLHEHEQGRAAIRGMSSALAGIHRGNPAAAADFVRNAADYIELLDRHIDKENNVLFVMADRFLSASQIGDLETAFQKLETEEVGEGRHQHYHRMLDDLTGRYVPADNPVAAGPEHPLSNGA